MQTILLPSSLQKCPVIICKIRQKKIFWGKASPLRKKKTISLQRHSCPQHAESEVTPPRSTFSLFIPYNLAVFASQMKLKYITALNAFYKLQWNLQLKRLYHFISNSTNTVISLHISQGFIIGLCGIWKDREKQRNLSITTSTALKYGTTLSVVSAPSLYSPKTLRDHMKTAEKTAALVTNVKAGEAAETHKLLPHGSIFLSYRSKFRDLGTIILAVGVKNELLSKIPLNRLLQSRCLLHWNSPYFLLREKPFGLFRPTLVIAAAIFRVIMLNHSFLKVQLYALVFYGTCN